MKNISKYNKTIRLDRIVHVVVRPSGQNHAFEGVSGDLDNLGKTLNITCSKDLYLAVLGEREGNVIRPGLRGKQRNKFLVRMEDREVEGKKVSVATGIDLIPLRYFVDASGPVEQQKNRKEGFEMEWEEAHNGFVVSKAYLGMNQKELENLLDDVRKNMGSKRSYRTKCGHDVKFLSESTLLVKNPKPYTPATI